MELCCIQLCLHYKVKCISEHRWVILIKSKYKTSNDIYAGIVYLSYRLFIAFSRVPPLIHIFKIFLGKTLKSDKCIFAAALSIKLQQFGVFCHRNRCLAPPYNLEWYKFLEKLSCIFRTSHNVVIHKEKFS